MTPTSHRITDGKKSDGGGGTPFSVVSDILTPTQPGTDNDHVDKDSVVQLKLDGI